LRRLPFQNYIVALDARNDVQVKVKNVLSGGAPVRLYQVQALATGRGADGASDFHCRLKNTSRLSFG
jgi:hypothetical protein